MYYFYHYHRNPYPYPSYPTAQTHLTMNPQFSNHTAQRQDGYPPVDPDRLYQSANQSQQLMADANKLVQRFATSKDFCTQVMDAAQRNNRDEVQRLIKSSGVDSDVTMYFNPDGLRLEFKSANIECCQLLIVLRWR